MKKLFHLIPLLSILISFYFIYHGVYGRRGFLRLQRIRQDIVQSENSLGQLNTQVSELKQKTEALKAGAQDLIEEELLRVLNMGNPDDLVVLDNPAE